MIVKLRTALLIVMSLGFGVACLILSANIRKGVIDGIDLCISTVIPSLFLFTVAANFAVKAGICRILGKLFHPFSTKLLNLSGEQFAVFLLSLVSGYPVGVSLVNELFKQGKISESKARKMSYFAVSAGPAFILIAVGEVSLGHRADGLRLLLAHLLASTVLCAAFGIISVFLKDKGLEPVETKDSLNNKASLADCFVESAVAASKTMFSVCTFVVVFGALAQLLSTDVLPFTPFVSNLLRALVEVTVGVQRFGRGRLALIAFLLGFGGISVHFQVLSVAKSIKLRYLPFLFSRILHGLLSAAAVELFELISPRYIDTAVTPAPQAALHGNPLGVLAMLLMGVILTVYTSKKKDAYTNV